MQPNVNRNYIVIPVDYSKVIVVPATSRNIEAYNILFNSETMYQLKGSYLPYDGEIQMKPATLAESTARAQIISGARLKIDDGTTLAVPANTENDGNFVQSAEAAE